MKRFICCVLTLVLGLFVCCAFTLTTKAAQSVDTIGRVYAYAPKVRVELKSSDQITDLKITLDGKEMRGVSWKPFNPQEDPVHVWLLVDVSASKYNRKAFPETKEQLKNVCTEVLEANPNNQVSVRIFGETVWDLEYTSQAELLEKLDNLQCRDQYTKLNEALKQTYMEATAQWHGDSISREYILLFSDGENCERSEKDPISEVIGEFSTRMIPVYAVCSADAKNGQPIKHLAQNSGGEVLFRGDDSLNFQEFWNKIQQVTLVEAEIMGIPPMGKECVLQIQNMPFKFTLDKQITDDQPPQAERVTGENGEITVEFSEDVTGADKLSAYTLKSGESQLRIDSVKYNEKSCTAILTVNDVLYDGSYTLEFANITDWQSNAINPTNMSLTVTGNPRPTVKSAQYDPTQNVFLLEFTNGVANANLPSAYEITDSTGHQLKIAAASYDSTAFSVTITPAEGETIYTGQYRIVFAEVRDLSQASAQLETAVCDVEAAKRPVKPALLIIPLICIAVVLVLVLLLVTIGRRRTRTSAENRVVNNEYEAQDSVQIKHHVMAEQSHPIVLYVRIGKTKEQTIQASLSRSLIVGRSASCEVCIDDEKMSRQHFAIEYHEDGFVIRDLDSMNGTWVNGFRLIGSRRLKSGDRVLAGLSDIAIHF